MSEAFEARILTHLSSFSPGKIRKILEVIDRLKAYPALEKKVRRAVDTNRFWEPNDGFFFEIGDLHSIADVRFMDVSVGSREIDVLTGSGMLIDQKYQINLKVSAGGLLVLDRRLSAQCQAMQAAVGSVVEGITVVSWKVHYVQPLTPAIEAELQTLGWTSNFAQGRTARSFI